MAGKAALAARAREEERQRLTDKIKEWNDHRWDLFELSTPNEVSCSFLQVKQVSITHVRDREEALPARQVPKTHTPHVKSCAACRLGAAATAPNTNMAAPTGSKPGT